MIDQCLLGFGPDGTMRSYRLVVEPPSLDEMSRIGEIVEEMLVEALVAQPAV